MPETIVLTPRERVILQSIIHNFIMTASPVGSRALARRFRMGLSPATVRNTMADLEEMGLLTHPHTSAGRLPTDLGYRIYVDSLMEVDELSDDLKRTLETRLGQASPETDDLWEKVSQTLAEISRLLTVIQPPDLSTGCLEKVELVRIASGRIIVVVVVNSGMVRTIMLELNSSISDEEIAAAAQLINQRLAGMRLSDIPAQITSRIPGSVGQNNEVVRLFLDFPRRIFAPGQTTEPHLGGTRHVLEQPEFSSPEKLRGIIELIDDREVIVHLLSERKPGVTITIGGENQPDRLRDFSVITSTYRVGDAMGTLGIIGPTRMNYSRLVPLVAFTASLMEKLLERRS